MADYVPLTYNEAVNEHDTEECRKAIAEELTPHQENETWILTPRKLELRPIDSKWVFRVFRDGEKYICMY